MPSDPRSMTRAEWVDAFAMQMGRLGVRASPEHLAEMGEELYPDLSDLDPVTVAQAEFDEWPPHDC